MATALVLEADGRRENGRWAYGHIMGEKNESVLSKSFAVRLKECGIVLDYKPDLAAEVVSGATTLNDAFTQAEAIRTSAEREKIMAREKAKREKAEITEVGKSTWRNLLNQAGEIIRCGKFPT